MATHYTGTQWIVTDDGIEQRDGDYIIRAQDLAQDMGEGGWAGHMAEKSWVDINDFKRALDVARLVHK